MKKTILLALCLMFGVSFASFAQTAKEQRVQKILEENQRKEIYKAELVDSMRGLRMGGEYSYRSFGTAGAVGANKHGFHYLAGYRFNKRWYLGAITGIDITTPFTVTNTEEGSFSDESLNYHIDREDKVYIPLIADIRYYCGINRVSTYLFTNIGAEFSSSTASIFTFGLGWDVHTVKDQCVNIGLGIGMGSWESAETSHMTTGKPTYELCDGFVFNFKLGYSF